MGLLDDIQISLNKGVAATERAATAVRLRAQLSDAVRRRQELVAQLGASLYDATKEDPELRAGREPLYDEIAAIDRERADIQSKIEEIERHARAESTSAAPITCPFCGTHLRGEDHFCMGCGKPMPEIAAAIAPLTPSRTVTEAADGTAPGKATAVCPRCQNAVRPGDSFCMSCGNPLGTS